MPRKPVAENALIRPMRAADVGLIDARTDERQMKKCKQISGIEGKQSDWDAQLQTRTCKKLMK
jgi:hypothetical protein